MHYAWFIMFTKSVWDLIYLYAVTSVYLWTLIKPVGHGFRHEFHILRSQVCCAQMTEWEFWTCRGSESNKGPKSCSWSCILSVCLSPHSLLVILIPVSERVIADFESSKTTRTLFSSFGWQHQSPLVLFLLLLSEFCPSFFTSLGTFPCSAWVAARFTLKLSLTGMLFPLEFTLAGVSWWRAESVFSEWPPSKRQPLRRRRVGSACSLPCQFFLLF